jgi:parvulin-like peptidyl-prolyl isomerase
MDGVRRPCRTLLLFFGVMAPACGVGEHVVARVGHHDVEVQIVQSYMGSVAGMRWQSVDDRVASRVLDQFLDQEVVAAAASGRRHEGIPTEPGPRSAAVRSLLAEVCGALPPLPKQALDREIERRLQEVKPARAHVRQMLLVSEEEAEIVRQRLDDGEPFVEVSREVSRAPNADAGGELGFVEKGTLPPDLDEVIFSMNRGEISPPVSSPAGYHVFQVLDVIPEGPADRSQIEVVARREMEENFARGFTRECVDRLAGEVGVTIHPEHLWFQYRGRYGGQDEA